MLHVLLVSFTLNFVLLTNHFFRSIFCFCVYIHATCLIHFLVPVSSALYSISLPRYTRARTLYKFFRLSIDQMVIYFLCLHILFFHCLLLQNNIHHHSCLQISQGEQIHHSWQYVIYKFLCRFPRKYSIISIKFITVSFFLFCYFVHPFFHFVFCFLFSHTLNHFTRSSII